MAENTLISPFLGTFMTAIFIFSTAYTLAFLYYQGVDTNRNIANDAGLDASATADDANNPKDGVGGIFGGLVDISLEFLSWISPFALVKALFIWMMKGTPEIYLVINLLILRPVSWITSVFTINYIISRLPTEHGEI